jgi:hypothetical protein
MIIDERVNAENFTMRTSDIYRGDRIEYWERRINRQLYTFSRVTWGDGSVTIRAYRDRTATVVHHWGA